MLWLTARQSRASYASRADTPIGPYSVPGARAESCCAVHAPCVKRWRRGEANIRHLTKSARTCDAACGVRSRECLPSGRVRFSSSAHAGASSQADGDNFFSHGEGPRGYSRGSARFLPPPPRGVTAVRHWMDLTSTCAGEESGGARGGK